MIKLTRILFSLGMGLYLNAPAFASIPAKEIPKENVDMGSLKKRLTTKSPFEKEANTQKLSFDIPVTYNQKVASWVKYYQKTGNNWFKSWIEKSTIYVPYLQKELKAEQLPQDLAYIVMIESGFEPNAKSVASAVGPWQFIPETGSRYGLKNNWWLDERRDFRKSTRAAIRYIRDLYKEFGSWYLVAASYNMGENGLLRQIKKHKTRDFWELSRRGALPEETVNYVPKILAAMLIAKAPSLYGFRNLTEFKELEYDLVYVPGGTDLKYLADHLGVTHKSLQDLNAELLLGYVPKQVNQHLIRIPKGAQTLVSEYIQKGERTHF